MGQMKVSVIVPVYNNEGTVEACIKSIQKQLYDNIEIIIIDDGSKDSTGEICRGIAEKDKRVKVIHQENSGVSVARNNGIKLSEGDLITFVDADDEIPNDYISELINSYQNSNADLVIGGIRLYYKDKTICMEYGINTYDFLSISYEEMLKILETWLMFPIWNKLFVREIISENGICFDNTFICGEDHLFVFEYLNYCKKVTFTNKANYNYFCLRSSGAKRKFTLENQIKIFEIKRIFIADHYDINYLNKYSAREAMTLLYSRVKKIIKEKGNVEDLKVAYEYYWKYIENSLEEKIFRKEDWTWFKQNEDVLVKGNMKSLYKKSKRIFMVSPLKKIKKVKNIVRECLK